MNLESINPIGTSPPLQTWIDMQTQSYHKKEHLFLIVFIVHLAAAVVVEKGVRQEKWEVAVANNWMDCWYCRDMIDDKMEVGHKEGNWMVANYHYNQGTFDCKALAFVDIVDTFEAVLGWFVGWLWYD